MNDQRIKQLFGAAKKETSATPDEGFELLVMQQIRRNPSRAELSISDLLGRWFPRVAMAASAIIIVSVVGDFVYSSDRPSLTESAAQVQSLAEN